MITPGILYWGGFACLFVAYAILVLYAVETSPVIHDEDRGQAVKESPAAVPEPGGEGMTPDRFSAPLKPSPLLTERERLAINTTIREWEFLQRAWDDAERLIRETERGR